MAQIVTTGQRALPRQLLALGFQFRYPMLDQALMDVLEHAGT
jgi:NAD dependent epimerase/dehydratase family enzyme